VDLGEERVTRNIFIPCHKPTDFRNIRV
jgi:hypothetical protein